MIPFGFMRAASGGGSSAARAAIVAFNFNSTGTKSITVAGETRTPTAVEFWYGQAATAGVEDADLYAGVGFSDGTGEYAVGGYGEDAATTTVEERRGDTDAMVLPNSVLAASLTSGSGGFKAGGCDLDVTTVSGTIRGVAIFYFAVAAEVVVHGYIANGAVNGLGSIDFTGAVGVVRAICGALLSHASDATLRGLSVGGGVGTTSSVTGQVCAMIEADHGESNTKRGCIWQTNRMASTYLNGVAQGDYELTGFGSSGIDTTASNRSGGTRYVGYLLLKFASGTNVWAGEITAPPNSGDWEAVSGGIGFTPEIALGHGTHMTGAAGTLVTEFGTGDLASVLSLFAATADDALCWAARQGDGSPAQNKTRISEQPLLWSYGGQGGSGTAYDVGAVTLTTKLLEAAAANINTAQSTARKMVGMAIG